MIPRARKPVAIEYVLLESYLLNLNEKCPLALLNIAINIVEWIQKEHTKNPMYPVDIHQHEIYVNPQNGLLKIETLPKIEQQPLILKLLPFQKKLAEKLRRILKNVYWNNISHKDMRLNNNSFLCKVKETLESARSLPDNMDPVSIAATNKILDEKIDTFSIAATTNEENDEFTRSISATTFLNTKRTSLSSTYSSQSYQEKENEKNEKIVALQQQIEALQQTVSQQQQLIEVLAANNQSNTQMTNAQWRELLSKSRISLQQDEGSYEEGNIVSLQKQLTRKK